MSSYLYTISCPIGDMQYMDISVLIKEGLIDYVPVCEVNDIAAWVQHHITYKLPLLATHVISV